MSDDLKPEWRKVLQCRSVLDKFAIPRSCELAPPYALPAISEMVREGIVVFVEPAWLAISESGEQAYCDVYQITPKGVALCDAHGIKRH